MRPTLECQCSRDYMQRITSEGPTSKHSSNLFRVNTKRFDYKREKTRVFIEIMFQQSEIGVFSCGPVNLNEKIAEGCAEANRQRDAPSFAHRFETF